ncbi:hypothetical protein [Streptomyces sp. H27-H5]|uniref:hypothetical protein n=1 Tax=Streptomyces sp. H27-H5 TaxID=2996460 RepID=UPI002271E440|nr:hypothetical protein [Streptomyces sp. H27-H5]MCY0962788.1 hypothetical protein [Streptomyces sp. H27-H5]
MNDFDIYPFPLSGRPAEPPTVARYLTVGGATVDLTVIEQLHSHSDGIDLFRGSTVAECAGCPASKEFDHWRLVWKRDGGQVEEHHPEAADRDARAWAQAHAEKCRAMPQQTGA